MDMGGTSFDVSLIAGGTAEPDDRVRDRVGAARLHADGRRQDDRRRRRLDRLDRQGRPAAGRAAERRRQPGPACYGRGGTRADGHRCQSGARAAQSRATSSAASSTLDVERGPGEPRSTLGEQLGWSIEDAASRSSSSSTSTWSTRSGSVSIDRGLDPRELHAGLLRRGRLACTPAALAEIIGIREVLVPIHQGVFSAFGLMTADMRVDESVTASLRSDLLDLERVNEVLDRLRSAGARPHRQARVTRAAPMLERRRDALPRPELRAPTSRSRVRRPDADGTPTCEPTSRALPRRAPTALRLRHP